MRNEKLFFIQDILIFFCRALLKTSRNDAIQLDYSNKHILVPFAYLIDALIYEISAFLCIKSK